MEPFMGQIMAVGFNYAPRGWAFCNGALIGIAQNSALFSLLGTMYGGNGTTNFALPDLRGRALVGMGTGPGLPNITQGEIAGSPNVTLLVSNLPPQNNPLRVSTSAGTLQTPVDGAFLAQSNQRDAQFIAGGQQGTTVALGGINPVGNGLPISVMQPYLGVNFIIALQGIFPSRN